MNIAFIASSATTTEEKSKTKITLAEIQLAAL